MKSFEEAIAIISDIATPFKHENVGLEEADGRILAENIYADRDYPPFNRAAMDGYAIMQNDWEMGIRNYNIVEVIYAGRNSKQVLVSGSCYKIMTGAATPVQADVIVRREDANELENEVILFADGIKKWQNIAIKGEDTKTGSLLLTAPCKCDPQIISLLASLGKATIMVFKLPTVAVITTGDEVISPDLPVSPYQIRNSNQYLLKALLKKWSITPWLCKHVSDNKDELKNTLGEALQSDIIITNGGVSAGDADYVPDVLKSLGTDVLFHKVSIRPGKPVWVGKTLSGSIVFALPGNPLSCLTTFTLFVEEYLCKCFCYKQRALYKLPLSESRFKNHESTDFFPVRMNKITLGLDLITCNGSGDITVGVSASGLAMHPDSTKQLNSGDMISYYPFY